MNVSTDALKLPSLEPSTTTKAEPGPKVEPEAEVPKNLTLNSTNLSTAIAELLPEVKVEPEPKANIPEGSLHQNGLKLNKSGEQRGLYTGLDLHACLVF